MHISRTAAGIVAIVAISLCASMAQGQASLSFGPHVGYAKSSDTDGKFLFGAALRAKFLPAIGLEGSITYRQDEFSDGTGTLKSWPVQFTALVYPLPVIYAAIGAGWYYTTVDYDDSLELDNETQGEFGWHFGGGIEVPVTGVAKLAVDIRYVYLDYKFEQLPGFDVQDNFYMLTAGFLFNL